MIDLIEIPVKLKATAPVVLQARGEGLGSHDV